MKGKRKLVLILFVLACCLILLLLLMLPGGRRPGPRGSPQPPNMAINLIGYSNAPSGARFALIGVTNLDRSKVFVYMPMIEVTNLSTTGGSTHLNLPRPLASASATLKSGKSQTFIFPVPTNEAAWRPMFYVSDNYGIKFITRFPYELMPFFENGNWIKNK